MREPSLSTDLYAKESGRTAARGPKLPRTTWSRTQEHSQVTLVAFWASQLAKKRGKVDLRHVCSELIYYLFYYFVKLRRHNPKCNRSDKVGEKFGRPKF